MKFKLDENLGNHGVALLIDAGHDVETVLGEKMGGAADDSIFARCRDEGRVLITLDHDFGHVLRFPPSAGPGIVILEAGPRTTPSRLLARIRDMLAALETQELRGSLWIVEPGRVRIYDRE